MHACHQLLFWSSIKEMSCKLYLLNIHFLVCLLLGLTNDNADPAASVFMD